MVLYIPESIRSTSFTFAYMSDWRRNLKYRLLVAFVKWLIWISARLPRTWLHRMFSVLGHLAFLIVRRERQKAIANLRVAYPYKGELERKRLAMRVFKSLAKNYADLARGLSIKTKRAFREAVRIDGEEHFIAAYRKGKGVLALNCHRGAFELAGTYAGLHYPTVGVGAKLKNEALDKLLVHNRTSRGIDYSHRGEGTLKMLRSLKQGKVVMMLIDQDTNKVKNVFVNFFGKRAATPLGAALLAQKTGCAVVPLAMSLQGSQQVLTILPEIPVVVTGNEEADIAFNTQNFSNAAEYFIKEYPEQWVWFHERWKTRPSS